ncbi:MAG: dihydroneopterin aldolase [Candidatus Actinomarina sp.]|nr:dihydroneopterin aldolase [Candidatus Actinomarina sp.]
MSFDIKIDGIKTFGKHGVYEFEKKEDQLFLIDLQINLNSDIAINDSINSTIDYEEYIEKVEHLVSTTSFNLIETLAQHLHSNLQSSKINHLIITVHKPNTALSKKSENISVTYGG